MGYHTIEEFLQDYVNEMTYYAARLGPNHRSHVYESIDRMKHLVETLPPEKRMAIEHLLHSERSPRYDELRVYLNNLCSTLH